MFVFFFQTGSYVYTHTDIPHIPPCKMAEKSENEALSSVVSLNINDFPDRNKKGEKTRQIAGGNGF